jgi:hypothetical protein
VKLLSVWLIDVGRSYPCKLQQGWRMGQSTLEMHIRRLNLFAQWDLTSLMPAMPGNDESGAW